MYFALYLALCSGMVFKIEVCKYLKFKRLDGLVL